MYRKWTYNVVSDCLCYGQSLLLAWTNPLAYRVIHTLRILNVFTVRAPGQAGRVISTNEIPTVIINVKCFRFSSIFHQIYNKNKRLVALSQRLCAGLFWANSLSVLPCQVFVSKSNICRIAQRVHRYRRHKNRLLKFVYVPAASAAHNRLLFFSFLLRPFTVLMKKTRAIKQSIIFRCLWTSLTKQQIGFNDFQSSIKITSITLLSPKTQQYAFCTHNSKGSSF